jgi:chemotaxis protein MotA
MMTGGHLGALYQPSELIIIGGAGIGAFIVGNNGKAIKGTIKALPLLFRRSKYTKSMYMDLLALLYRLMAKSRQQGMFSLERDIENPKESEIFASYRASSPMPPCSNLSLIICALSSAAI